MKLLVNLADRGNNWECISINRNEMQMQNNEGIIYEIFSWDVYETIALTLNNGGQVYIPKNLEGQLEVSDLIINVFDELETAKNTAIIKMKDIMYNTRLNKLTLVEYFSFTILNNWFINKGYIITNDNREEKYLELISSIAEMEEAESNVTIENLEKYLNALDKLSELTYFIADLENNIKEVNDAVDITEVDAIYNAFTLVYS